MSDLVRRLKTELTRSPKKTAILGIGLAVAAVFWGRMLWKPSEEVETATETNPASAQFVAPVVPSIPLSRSLAPGGSAGPKATGTGEPSWGDLLVWMRSSFEEESVDPAADVARDPFDASDPTLAIVSVTEEPESEATSEGEAPAPEEIVPPPDPGREAAQALVVQGILKIGSQRFVRLGGKTLAMGESFELSAATDENGQSEIWIVVDVDGDSVTIRRSTGGDPVVLELSKSDLSGIRMHLPEGQ
jgi:hypothetical protein